MAKSSTNGHKKFDIPAGSVIYLSTTTHEKIRYFTMAAQAQGLPIEFKPFAAITETCNSPDEDEGASDKNAKKKAEQAVLTFKDFYRRTRIDKAFQSHYEKLGISPNKPVYVATEDSRLRITGLPRTLFDDNMFDWTGLEVHREKLLKRVEQEHARGNTEFHLVDCFPDVELGPVLMDCGGERAFFRRVQKGLDRLAQKMTGDPVARWEQPLGFESGSVLVIHKMQPRYSDAGQGHYVEETLEEPFKLESLNKGSLTFSPQPNADVILSPQHRLPALASTLHYNNSGFNDKTYATLDDEEDPETRRKYNYTIKLSERADIIRQLARHAAGKQNGRPRHLDHFHVGIVNPEGQKSWKARIEAKLGKNNGTKTSVVETSTFKDTKLDHLDNELLKKTDAWIFGPWGKQEGAAAGDDHMFHALLEQLFALSTGIVSKQLEVNSFDKPLIIYNPNNGADAALALINDLMQRRLIGGRIGFYPPNVENGSAPHYDPRNLIEVMTTEEQLVDFLKHKRDGQGDHHEGRHASYDIPPLPDSGAMKIRPYRATKAQSIKMGETVGRKNDKFNVAIFCSSASQNDLNLKRTRHLSYALASNDFGVVCGAGDRYMMGAITDGVNDWRNEIHGSNGHQRHMPVENGGYLTGSSTPVILYRETESGNIPQGYNRFHLAPTIYKRMEFLESESDAFVVMEGGAGTVQEFAAVKLLVDGKQSNKPIIICNTAINNDDGRCWQSLIGALLGKTFDADFSLTEDDRKRLRKRNIHIADDETDAMALLREFRDEHLRRREIPLNDNERPPLPGLPPQAGGVSLPGL
ncbi:MAG: LOG family protein [Pseudomonadota bacterium]|nr:LOG family protein [Pseudomonadota bacterium]